MDVTIECDILAIT